MSEAIPARLEDGRVGPARRGRDLPRTRLFAYRMVRYGWHKHTGKPARSLFPLERERGPFQTTRITTYGYRQPCTNSTTTSTA